MNELQIKVFQMAGCKTCKHNRRQSGKYEGDLFDRCLHIHCNNIIAEFCKEHNENEYSHDWIVDWLSDLYCYGCGQNEDDNCEIKVLQCNCVIRNFKNLRNNKI